MSHARPAAMHIFRTGLSAHSGDGLHAIRALQDASGSAVPLAAFRVHDVLYAGRTGLLANPESCLLRSHNGQRAAMSGPYRLQLPVGARMSEHRLSKHCLPAWRRRTRGIRRRATTSCAGHSSHHLDADRSAVSAVASIRLHTIHSAVPDGPEGRLHVLWMPVARD